MTGRSAPSAWVRCRLSIEGRPDRTQAITTIHASLDAGVTIIDTADAYALNTEEHGHGERLVAKALATYGGSTDHVLVATKGGHRRPGDGSWTVHGDPGYIKQACDASLMALGRRVDRPVPVPPSGPEGPLCRFRRRPGRPPRRREDPDGRHLQRHGGADRRGPGGPRAGGWSACRTSSRPVSAPRRASWSTARSIGVAFIPWSPLGGIGRSGSHRRATSRPSPKWQQRWGPRRSRSRWPGCWPRARGSSRFREAAARRRPRLRRRRPTWCSPPNR